MDQSALPGARPYTLHEPAGPPTPFLFNSPHSGRDYPASFLAASRLDALTIRRSEDFAVDVLFAGAVRCGAPLLAATLPRAYLDVNREPYELDPAMFADPLPAFANVRSPRVAGGLGTIARIVTEQDPIYARKLTVAEGLERIETVYKPYHRALGGLLARTHRRCGQAVLVDCHSMPSMRESGGRSRPDMVLGDRFGTACAAPLVLATAEILADLGYDVEINKPYAGGFITEHYGRPEHGLHALQIEVNRALYMDERRLERTAGFAALAADMAELARRMVALPLIDMAGPRRLAAE